MLRNFQDRYLGGSCCSQLHFCEAQNWAWPTKNVDQNPPLQNPGYGPVYMCIHGPRMMYRQSTYIPPSHTQTHTHTRTHTTAYYIYVYVYMYYTCTSATSHQLFWDIGRFSNFLKHFVHVHMGRYTCTQGNLTITGTYTHYTERKHTHMCMLR